MFVKLNTDVVIWEVEFMGKKEKRWFWDSLNFKGREKYIIFSKNFY